MNQELPPIGTMYQGYNLTEAINEYVLDPNQYSITNFKFGNNQGSISGLVYKNVPDFNQLNNEYDLDRRSSKDISALSYRQFLSGNGEFDSTNNKQNLWYSTASGGPALTPQVTEHIILEESQRGGLNTNNLVKYSLKDKCEYFDYNQRYSRGLVNNPYVFDKEYCLGIGINNPF
jgi:hypothetical protein